MDWKIIVITLLAWSLVGLLSYPWQILLAGKTKKSRWIYIASLISGPVVWAFVLWLSVVQYRAMKRGEAEIKPYDQPEAEEV